MDMTTHRLDLALRTAVARIVRMLARVLLRHGVPYSTFAELSKHAFVEVALSDFNLPGRKPSFSRAALLTGLTRKDVQRLANEQEDDKPTDTGSQHRAARVIAGWVRDKDFHDKKGKPKPLNFEQGSGSFADLVRRYSGDVPPRAVLDELLRVGSVERDDDGTVRLLTRVYIPRQSDVGKLGILGTDVSYLIDTIDHNLQGLEPARFQRKVMYDNLPHEAMDELRALSAKHAQELIELLDARMARHDRDANPSVRGNGRVRAGLGVFFFEEKLND